MSIIISLDATLIGHVFRQVSSLCCIRVYGVLADIAAYEGQLTLAPRSRPKAWVESKWQRGAKTYIQVSRWNFLSHALPRTLQLNIPGLQRRCKVCRSYVNSESLGPTIDFSIQPFVIFVVMDRRRCRIRLQTLRHRLFSFPECSTRSIRFTHPK